MAKGYWIAHIDVKDLDGFRDYIPLSTLAVKESGGRFLVRGGTTETAEGELRPRHVVIEFPSYEAAVDCYRSQQYAAAKSVRQAYSEADIAIVEGFE
jgi:uncharacterized protein (DUF1330 family)